MHSSMKSMTRRLALLTGLASLYAPGSAAAADQEFKASLAVSEEYTDNVLELAGAKRSEFVTRVQPGASLRYRAPLWNWNIAYNLDYRSYARGSKGDEITHNADLKGTIYVRENFIFLDVSDTYHRVTLDVSRSAATESSLFLNQTDQNTAFISPWLLWRPTAKSRLKTGYSYSDTRYWGTGVEKQEQRGNADLNHEITAKLSLTAAYVFTRLTSAPGNYSKHDLSAGFRYEYADKSFLFASAGNSWQQFDHNGSVDYPFWNAGLTYDTGGTVTTLETSVQNTEDPLAVSTKETSYRARFDKTLQRGALGLSTGYSEFVNTRTDVMDHKRLSFGGTARYEVLPSLTANLGLTAERFSQKLVSDLPYRFSGTAGLNYAFKNELTLGLTYSYTTELSDLDTTDGAKEINRAVVEVKKTF